MKLHRISLTPLLIVARICITTSTIADAAPAPVASTQSPATWPASSQPADGPSNPYLSAAAEPHMDAEYEAAFAAVEASLDKCVPDLTVPSERRDALIMLDLLFHDPYARQRKPVQEFHLRQSQRIADELEHAPPPTEGATVYMFYNMGFIVRTRSVTLGFDLIRGEHLQQFALPDDLMRRVIGQCDALFISHVHLDHADPWVAQVFLDQGKPVMAPPDLWADQPINAHLTCLKRDSTLKQTVPLQNGKHQIGIVTNPGFQNVKTGENVTCDVYVVQTPERVLIAHTGDNNVYRPAGLNWNDENNVPQRIDVLLLNDWTMTLAPKTLRGYDPRLVIAGHFDELGHDNVNARAPYWRGLLHGEKSVYPWLVMTWGESFHYNRDAMPASPTTASSPP